jgi:hypothetical protein
VPKVLGSNAFGYRQSVATVWRAYHVSGGDFRTAEEILAERYAHGEIHDAEHQCRLAVLRANETPDIQQSGPGVIA